VEMRARDIARDLARIPGLTVELRGNDSVQVDRVSSFQQTAPDTLVFVERTRDVSAALKGPAAVVILPLGELRDVVGGQTRAVIGVSDVRRAMPSLLRLFDPRPVPPPGIHATASVGKKAVLGANVSLGPYVVVGDGCVIEDDVVLDSLVSVGPGSRIGAGSRLFAGVRVYDGVTIGRRCLIHSGTVIGSDGYGYVSGPAGHQKVPQIGGVRIEDDVEIGANVAIDRGTVGDTIVGSGTKIDNLVHLAHNVQVGSHSLIIAQSGIAGSTRIGNWVVLAAQSGVTGHIEIGDRTMVGARSGVTKPIPAGRMISGFPARHHPDEKRIKASFGRLPEMVRDVSRLQAAVLRLSRRLSAVEQVEACSTR